MNITPPTGKEVVFIDNDTFIQQLLVENCRTMPRNGTHNTCLIGLRDEKRKTHWFVLRCFHEGDSGYLAFGVAPDSPKEFKQHIADMILSKFDSKCLVLADPITAN